eukprot:CAMPEP_0117559484 /NCGR_PEP_ID=MMETSP0784-20121206/53387_1 /TAXON_ID=39447 /ORGANISM="" /LENGTH=136 /DNA_ID=CAMNT_0005356869 /DNA_START=59 /DNA_END=466 /DNA_ORIENTATION=-
MRNGQLSPLADVEGTEFAPLGSSETAPLFDSTAERLSRQELEMRYQVQLAMRQKFHAVDIDSRSTQALTKRWLKATKPTKADHAQENTSAIKSEKAARPPFMFAVREASGLRLQALHGDIDLCNAAGVEHMGQRRE